MEHESFEDAEIAQLLNDHFVSIKVDREERPDVDEAYMTAVQLSSGRGGWPMSVFMTPDKKPFFAGTYFPKDDRGDHPGLKSVLAQIAYGWSTKRAEFTKAAEEFSKALAQAITKEAPKTFTKLDRSLLDSAFQSLAASFDQQNGGFGGAPKFPPHSALRFLLQYAAIPGSNEDQALASISMSIMTLEAMAAGGLHDRVGGGFHRYSTDEMWLLPHFEKMLYDNALMLANYARALKIARAADASLSGIFANAVDGILRWLQEEMAGPNGLYYSALDADSEGVEGKFYVWSVEEVKQLLGPRADAFIEAFSLRPEGNFHDESQGTLSGLNVLYEVEEHGDVFNQDLKVLHDARNKRVKPALDDKQLVAWNALLISGLVEAGELEIAGRAAHAILAAEKEFGSLPHQVMGGKPSGEAFLDSYAAFILALLDLGDAEDSEQWRLEAVRLAVEMVERFYDRANGGFFFTSVAHEELFGRTKPVFDQPVPSGNSMAIQAMLRLGDLGKGKASLEAFVGWMERAPQATEGLLTAVSWLMIAEPLPEEPVAAPTPLTADVKVTLEPRELVAASGHGKGTVVLVIPEGFHLNNHEPPANWLVPTSLEFAGVKASVDYPAGQDDKYLGRVEIPVSVELPAGQEGADFELTVKYQACTDQECLLPVERKISGVVVKG
jgi:uncharacterized protein YyaL (SSP411 family)